MLAHEYELDTWESKRDKIMIQFEKENTGMEVYLNEGGDRNIERPIRLGKGRSRLDQLE